MEPPVHQVAVVALLVVPQAVQAHVEVVVLLHVVVAVQVLAVVVALLHAVAVALLVVQAHLNLQGVHHARTIVVVSVLKHAPTIVAKIAQTAVAPDVIMGVRIVAQADATVLA